MVFLVLLIFPDVVVLSIYSVLPAAGVIPTPSLKLDVCLLKRPLLMVLLGVAVRLLSIPS